MSDNVPSDKSKAPGSDQSQPHLSDRQATAGENTERQAPDREKSGPPLSDRQATAQSELKSLFTRMTVEQRITSPDFLTKNAVEQAKSVLDLD